MKSNIKISIIISVISILTLGSINSQTQFDAQDRTNPPVGSLELVESQTTSTSLTVNYSVDDMNNVMNQTSFGVAYSPMILVYEEGNTNLIQSHLIGDLSTEKNSMIIYNLTPGTNYTIALSVPYDINGDGIPDNQVPYIISQINASTKFPLPTVQFNQDQSSSTTDSITVNFDFFDTNNLTTNLYAELYNYRGEQVQTINIDIVDDQTNYQVTFDTNLNPYQVYQVNIVADIDNNADSMPDELGIVLASELFETNYNNTAPIGEVFDITNGSTVTDTSITVGYEIIDYYNVIMADGNTVYPRIVLTDEDQNIMSVNGAEVHNEQGLVSTVVFDNLTLDTQYNVYLSAQYDINQDGINDNIDPSFKISNTVSFTTLTV